MDLLYPSIQGYLSCFNILQHNFTQIFSFFFPLWITDDSDVRRTHRAVQNAAGREQQPIRRPRLWKNVSCSMYMLACKGYISSGIYHCVYFNLSPTILLPMFCVLFSECIGLFVCQHAHCVDAVICQQPWWTASASHWQESMGSTKKPGSHYEPSGK